MLGVGTEQGAPIPLPEGGYLKNQQGTIVVPQLNRTELRDLAIDNGGQYQEMTVNESDLKALLPKAGLNDDVLIVERDFDQWHDAGYWLLLLILPLALAGFRRGWLMAVMLCILLPATPEAQAFGWKDLWQTADQQGQKALQNNDAETAAGLFNNPQWKGEALFRSDKFEEAAKEFAKVNTASSIYNKGNALAKAGKLQEALDTYDEALKQQPDFADAKTNRKLVEDLLKQQQQEEEEEQKQQNKDQQDKNQNKDDQQNSDKQDQQNQNDQPSDESKSEEQQSDQQQSDQQQSDQQQSDQQQSDQQQSDQQQSDQQQSDQQQSDQQQSDQQQSDQQQSDQQQSDQQQSDNQQKDAEEQQKEQNQKQQEQSDKEQEQKEQQGQPAIGTGAT